MKNISKAHLRKILSENIQKERSERTTPISSRKSRILLETRLLIERKSLLDGLSTMQKLEQRLENANANITANMIVNEGIMDTIKGAAKKAGKFIKKLGYVKASPEDKSDFAFGSQSPEDLLADAEGPAFKEEINDLKKDINAAKSAYQNIRINLRGLLLSPEVKESDFENIFNYTGKVALVQAGQFKLLSLIKSFDKNPEKSKTVDTDLMYKGVKGKINVEVFNDLKPYIDEAAEITGQAKDLLKKIMDNIRPEIDKIKSTIDKNAEQIAKYIGEFDEEIDDALKQGGEKFATGKAGVYGGGKEGRVSKTRRERWGYGDEEAKKSFP